MGSSRTLVHALGLWLLATLGVAYVALGGVGSGVQALLHLLIAGGAALALALPDRKLAAAGAARRWTLAAAVLAGALVVGLVPVPRVVAAWLAPGLLAARPEASYHALATDPSRVPLELANVVLIGGFGALVVLWGTARHRRNEAESAIVGVTGAVALSGALHAWFGASSMLGWIVPQSQLQAAPFFAPFVNANHAASVMVLGGPVALGVALDPEQGLARRFGAGVVTALVLGVLAASGSGGAVLASVAVALLWVLRARGLGLSVLGAVVALALAVQVWASATWGFAAGSAAARAVLWRDSLRMWRDFWLAGSGGGTFGEAIRSYRTDRAFLAYAHAHNDLLEWLVETGVVGALALVLALVLVGRGLSLPRRADGLVFGLVGLVLHSLVEFPLQMPAIAMSAAAVAACALGVFSPSSPSAPRAVRALVVVVGLLQLPAAAWRAREMIIDHAKDDVYAIDLDPARAAVGARTLELTWAGGPERLLFEAWSAERAHDSKAAVAAAAAVVERYPDAPDALREAALVLARAEDYAGATTVLLRVVARDPSDYRPWVILARLARTQGEPLLAQQRWSEAFHREAPPDRLAEAYAVLPSGLVWLESFSDAPALYSMELAIFLAARDKPDEALLALEQAGTLDPVGYGDVLMRPRLLVAVGRPEEAERWIREVQSRRPDDNDVLIIYGDLLASLGRYSEATAMYAKASIRNPAVRVKTVASAELEGGPAHALEVARAFELEGTVDPALRLQIAAVRMRSGDALGCKQEIEQWSLTTSLVGTQAAELLATCTKLARPSGG